MNSNKSLVFLAGRFGVGGVECVTVDLANGMHARGWQIGIVIFEEQAESMLSRLDDGICVERLSWPVLSVSNIRKFRNFLRRQECHYVINQWSLPVSVSVLLRCASVGLNVKLLVMQHTMPSMNGRILKSSGLKRSFWTFASRISLHLVCSLNDAFLVLSKEYVNELKQFAWLRCSSRIKVVCNPVSLVAAQSRAKENLIIFVGRLSQEKRVDRILNVWEKLEKILPDWKLEIVGDGIARAKLEGMAKSVLRCRFVGFAKPDEYYRRAKIILMASDFEGFGLVLVEAMSAHCVPVVYGNYAAARDLIDSDRGTLLQGEWDCDTFVDAVKSIASNDVGRQLKAEAGYEFSKRFNMNEVSSSYEQLLEAL